MLAGLRLSGVVWPEDNMKGRGGFLIGSWNDCGGDDWKRSCDPTLAFMDLTFHDMTSEMLPRNTKNTRPTKRCHAKAPGQNREGGTAKAIHVNDISCYFIYTFVTLKFQQVSGGRRLRLADQI